MKPDNLVGDADYYSDLATLARRQYDHKYAAGYRESDDHGVNGPTHTDLGNLLTEISMSFDRQIAVLDLGCGTGRYFHCLKNLKSITGVDVSTDMLRLARHPVRESAILVPVTLVCTNIAEVHFKDQSFDLIYSMGVLGEYLPLDGYVCEKVVCMLKRGGSFVFTTVEKNLPRATSWKRRAAETLLPVLPIRLKRIVKSRLRSLFLSEAELRSTMDKTQFSSYTMKRRYSPTGRNHIVCVAHKY